jgi:hypothetical protein
VRGAASPISIQAGNHVDAELAMQERYNNLDKQWQRTQQKSDEQNALGKLGHVLRIGDPGRDQSKKNKQRDRCI